MASKVALEEGTTRALIGIDVKALFWFSKEKYA